MASLRRAMAKHMREAPHQIDSGVLLQSECPKQGFELSYSSSRKEQQHARRVVGEFIEHYNTVRLHSAIGYVAPEDKLERRAEKIQRARDEKLEAARAERANKRLEVAEQ